MRDPQHNYIVTIAGTKIKIPSFMGFNSPPVEGCLPHYSSCNRSDVDDIIQNMGYTRRFKDSEREFLSDHSMRRDLALFLIGRLRLKPSFTTSFYIGGRRRDDVPRDLEYFCAREVCVVFTDRTGGIAISMCCRDVPRRHYPRDRFFHKTDEAYLKVCMTLIKAGKMLASEVNKWDAFVYAGGETFGYREDDLAA
jgi:hypothetical protein